MYFDDYGERNAASDIEKDYFPEGSRNRWFNFGLRNNGVVLKTVVDITGFFIDGDQKFKLKVLVVEKKFLEIMILRYCGMDHWLFLLI